ncbi:MAG: hypothetical protein ACREME_12585 [Gemmatimonadales bacterium]
MRRWSSSSALAAVAILCAAQGPGTRLTYRVRVLERAAPPDTTVRVLGSGSVSGPLDTDMRLSLRTDSAEVEALFQVTPAGDTVSLGAEFFTRRRIKRSRRGLPLWEQDSYRRVVRMTWTDTARIHPFGRPQPAPAAALWVELALDRGFAGGASRPAEELQLEDSLHDFRVEAVVRPRRARVILNLVRGSSVSGPRGLDLIPGGAARRMRLVLAGRATILELGLSRPQPPRALRDRVLALDADVVCLHVATPGPPEEPVGTTCGRLNNVARRVPLPSGDTLMATFAWPGSR